MRFKPKVPEIPYQQCHVDAVCYLASNLSMYFSFLTCKPGVIIAYLLPRRKPRLKDPIGLKCLALDLGHGCY